MTASSPSISALAELFSRGHARVPESWELTGPTGVGFWWRARGQEVVGTPLLLWYAQQVSTEGERVGLLLATEPRYREPWLEVTAVRLADLGRRGELAELCRQIEVLGAAASTLKNRIGGARLTASPYATLELALFGAPADQSAAIPGLLRVLGQTAALVEGGQGIAPQPLWPVDSRDPSINWTRGRLIQGPGVDAPGGSAVLRGAVKPCGNPQDKATRMAWVLETPWVTLLAILAFTAEAWEAERQGGLQLELPARYVYDFVQPSQIEVVVTLADGQEVLCGTLGELCLRVLDALGMAVVPPTDVEELDRQLGYIVPELLRTGVWAFRPEARTRYFIGEAFSFDCYRGEGHRYIYLSAEDLSQTLRDVAVAWAKARVERASREVTA